MKVSLLCFVQRLIKSERKFDRHVKDGRRQAPGGNRGQGDAHTNVQDMLQRFGFELPAGSVSSV
jgi:virulence-associated protein VapD